MFIQNHLNSNSYIDDFNKVKGLLSDKYGNPVIDRKHCSNNEIWCEDPNNAGTAVSMGMLTFGTQWETKDTTIVLGLTGDNLKIHLGIVYQSKVYKDLIEKSDKAKDAGKL